MWCEVTYLLAYCSAVYYLLIYLCVCACGTERSKGEKEATVTGVTYLLISSGIINMCVCVCVCVCAVCVCVWN